ncbi:hypothetical protein ALC60_07886 [Trachymyrmex zeteki]|uniref:Uncharacterized protein n=1 Tax=Mycetomoellerius zeteki TaxID=64791 RepID=A0A151WZF0_9HYME|nr:hypothetical protein ALC60_07886 [Trachymyrmex zeteki]
MIAFIIDSSVIYSSLCELGLYGTRDRTCSTLVVSDNFRKRFQVAALITRMRMHTPPSSPIRFQMTQGLNSSTGNRSDIWRTVRPLAMCIYCHEFASLFLSKDDFSKAPDSRGRYVITCFLNLRHLILKKPKYISKVRKCYCLKILRIFRLTFDTFLLHFLGELRFAYTVSFTHLRLNNKIAFSDRGKTFRSREKGNMPWYRKARRK